MELPLARTDLGRVYDQLSPNASHDDKVFLAQLLNAFHGLFRLGELVWPDSTCPRVRNKLLLRTSVRSDKDGHSFVLPTHKVDPQFEGSTIVIHQSQIHPDPHYLPELSRISR